MEVWTAGKILDADIVIVNGAKKVLVKNEKGEKVLMEFQEFAELVKNYLSLKEKNLENHVKNSNKKAFEESYYTYKRVVLKANEMGIPWQMKRF
jgi:hypothetical protein